MLSSQEVEALFTLLAKAELENASLNVIAGDFRKHFPLQKQFRIASALSILLVNRILTPAQRLSALYFNALQKGSGIASGKESCVGPFLPFLLDLLDSIKYDSIAERQFLVHLLCGKLEEVSLMLGLW